MNKIISHLHTEHEHLEPLLTHFLDEQIERYGSLSEEYHELLLWLKEHLLRGGKWHRPALALLAYRIAGGKMNKAVEKAVLATEVMHRFLLIHDDIIDHDLIRHGGPTIEKLYQDRFMHRYPEKTDERYSIGMAIVAGDVVKTMAYQLVAEAGLEPGVVTATIQGLNQLLMETAAGWQLQTEQNFMKIAEVTEADFLKGMQLVSAQYSVVWPLRIGQILAGRVTQDLWDENLETCGWHTGAAFQIRDDILGMFGDERTTGKPVGHDYREGKKTFLVLAAYRLANQADRTFLENTLGTDVSPKEAERAQQIIKQTGALAEVEQKAADHIRQAHEALQSLKSNDQAAIELLDDLASFLGDRSY